MVYINLHKNFYTSHYCKFY